MDKPLPRSFRRTQQTLGGYDEARHQLPDQILREPIGDYSDLPEELADLTHDPAGLSRVDDFITRFDGQPSTAVAHALSM